MSGGRSRGLAGLLLGAALGPVAAHAGPVRPPGDGPAYLLLGAGIFDAFNEKGHAGEGDRTAAGNVEFRLGPKLLGVGPALGMTANVHGGLLGYAGLYADLPIAGLVVTPLLGAGAYAEGHSKDLGGRFAVRIELGVARELADGVRLGVRWGHVSNAYLYEDNPSEEEYLLTYAWPF